MDTTQQRSTLRTNFQNALDKLTDEAFGYAVIGIMKPGFKHGCWPDGLGGFMPDSQASIKVVLETGTRFMTNGEYGFVEK